MIVSVPTGFTTPTFPLNRIVPVDSKEMLPSPFTALAKVMEDETEVFNALSEAVPVSVTGPEKLMFPAAQ